MLEQILSFLKPYLFYIVIAFVGLFLLRQVVGLIFREIQARWHSKWREKREHKQELKKKKEAEKQALEHRIVHANNWLLNQITKTRIIVFKGLAGKGKTLLMQVFSKFLVDKFHYIDIKNYRYNKIMNTDYLERREKLKKDGFLPAYSINLENVSCPMTGLKVQENGLEILKQQCKANSPAVLQIDEMSSVFPKSSIFEVRAEKDAQKRLENEEIKEFARKLRHYGMWMLGTEQDGDDILKDIRQFGFATITAIDTKVEISKRGMTKQKLSLFWQKWGLGWFVSNWKMRLNECLFLSDKIKTIFKLFKPGFYSCEKQFYINRNQIYKKIKENYTVFKTLFDFEGKHYWLFFTNKQKLNYNTTAYRAEYDEKFNAAGTRKLSAFKR